MNPHLAANSPFGKTASLIICTLSYLIVLWLCFALYPYFSHWGPVYSALILDVIATVVIWFIGTLFRNASLYDPYWSVAPVPIALFWWGFSHFDTNDYHKILAFIAVCVWAIRLTLNWWRGWVGLTHEDWRYGMLRQKSGVFYPLVNLLGIHLFPTFMVFLGCLPLYYVMALVGESSNAWLGWVGFAVSIGGALLELIADEQMRSFKRRNVDNPQAFIDEGLWYYSRHPNYFGEILFWTGLYLIALSADISLYWTGSGFLAMWLMFRFISIPMMDERTLKKRPAYSSVMGKVSGLVPWFRKE